MGWDFKRLIVDKARYNLPMVADWDEPRDPLNSTLKSIGIWASRQGHFQAVNKREKRPERSFALSPEKVRGRKGVKPQNFSSFARNFFWPLPPAEPTTPQPFDPMKLD